MANSYYPALSTVISVNQILEDLNFIATSIDDLLDQVYFKDLKLEKSNDGSTYSCLLDIVSASGILELEIQGMRLIFQLNPDPDNPNDNITVFYNDVVGADIQTNQPYGYSLNTTVLETPLDGV